MQEFAHLCNPFLLHFTDRVKQSVIDRVRRFEILRHKQIAIAIAIE